MAWTATLVTKTRERDKWTFQVSFTDGTTTVNEAIEVINPDVNFLTRAVKAKLDRLAGIAGINAATPIGPVAAPPVDPTLTPTQQQFITGVTKLQRMMKAVDLGLILVTNAQLVALRDQIKAAVVNDPTLLDLVDV